MEVRTCFGRRETKEQDDIMPKRLLQDVELAALNKLSRKDGAKAKRHIVVPKKRATLRG